MSAAAPSYAPTFSADPQTTAHVTEAINFLLASVHCPSKHRAFVDYLVGASGGNLDWFEAADEEVGYAARPSDGPASRGAACKWVQRERKSFLAWEERAKVSFVECYPGGRDPKTKQNFKSKYRVKTLLTLAEETVRDAQSLSVWGRDERRALELTAAEKTGVVERGRARRDRFRAPRRDEDALLQRNPKTALTLLTAAYKIKVGRGETDEDTFVAEFAGLLREALRNAPPCAPNLSTLNTEESGQTRGGTGGQRKPLRASCRACGASWEIGTGLHVCPPVGANPPKNEQIGGDNFVPPPTPDEAEAAAAVELFESVGAVEFGVTVKNEMDGGCDYDVMTGDGLREFLPPLLKRNQAKRESVIVRPEAERVAFWQVDDGTEATRALLRDVSFAVIETSPGSYQCWLAVTDEEEKEVLDAARARLLASVKATGGNGGSYGAVRLPGTINQKPEREEADGTRPVVKIVEANHGRTTTVAELEERGLLAPVSEEKPRPKSNVVDINPANRPWPSYDKALADAPPKENGQPDRSDADFKWCLLSFLRGKGYEEVRARLLEVSESAREKTAHYVNRTLARAEKAART